MFPIFPRQTLLYNDKKEVVLFVEQAIEQLPNLSLVYFSPLILTFDLLGSCCLILVACTLGVFGVDDFSSLRVWDCFGNSLILSFRV